MEFHEYEVGVLKALAKQDNVTISVLATNSNLQEIQVKRAVQWLSNKKLITSKKQAITIYNPGPDANKSSPDLIFLQHLQSVKSISKTDLIKATKQPEQLFNAAVGRLIKQKAVKLNKKGQDIVIEVLEGMADAYAAEKKFVDQINKGSANNFVDTSDETIKEALKRKGILEKITKAQETVSLTKEGASVAKDESKLIAKANKVTTEMLTSGDYKNIDFRKFEVNDDVPSITGGRKHFVTQAKEYIKSIWLEMGFNEMTGDMVQPVFWDLDALFVPQDHPARAMQDTFYIDHVSNLDNHKKLVEAIKKVHEDGGNTGSLGWQYKFDKNETQRTLLRTHCTVLSALALANLNKTPAKLFAVGKVFRNETMDWSHLFEFHQVDGIVVDENASFSELLGYLKKFFGKMGYPDVRIRPAYFPYTEPSAEVEVWHPKRKKWVELGGCGVFRPEVVIPLLGKDIPVLAWGLGMERLIVEEFGFQDLRDLYSNDIEQLQTIKQFMRL